MLAAVIGVYSFAAPSRRNSSSSSSSTARKSSSNGFYGQYSPSLSSKYETLKRQDWTTFRKYLRAHASTLSLAGSGEAIVVDFLRYLDGFGKTKVHAATCGSRFPTGRRCDCPTRQHWTVLVDLVERLRDAFCENGGHPLSNPFNSVVVDDYLDDAMSSQIRWR